MPDTNKMLRTIINGQSAMKSELLSRIDKLQSEMDRKFDTVDDRFDSLEEKLTKRIDKLGLQIANLEDDSPTIGEFDKLEVRVTKVEKKVAII